MSQNLNIQNFHFSVSLYMPATKPKTEKALTRAQLERGNLSEFKLNVGSGDTKWESLNIVTDANSLMHKSNPYDPVSPNSWLMFSDVHPGQNSVRMSIFDQSYNYPVATPAERLGNGYRPVKEIGGFHYTVRNPHNRLNKFYNSFCPGVGNGLGLTVTAKTPKQWPNAGKIMKLATNVFRDIWYSDNERCVKPAILAPPGWYDEYAYEHWHTPGYLGEGLHTVQLGYRNKDEIIWTPEKRDFFGLPVFQYVDLSVRDKETVAEFQLPTSFNKIKGTWYVPSNASDAIQYGPSKKVGVAKQIKYGKGTWGLGYGYSENDYASNTIEDLSRFKWTSPKEVTVDQMIKSFYIGADGKVSIKKYSDYAKLITPFRKNNQILAWSKSWFHIKLYWVPTNHNPVNTVDTIVHCVGLLVKF